MTPTAEEIIERVKARYAGCRTYQDAGMVTTTLVRAFEGRHTLSGTFRTAVERPFTEPIRFAFEFASDPTTEAGTAVHFRAWTNSTLVFRTARGAIEEVRSVDHALGSVAPVVGFMPRIVDLITCADASFLDPATSTVRGEEIDGTAFHVVAGSVNGDQVSVWIESASLLIWRVDRTLDLPSFIVEEQTTLIPRMDIAIDPKAFDFVEPG